MRIRNFRGYDTDLSLNNQRYDASIGSRVGDVSWAVYANHLEAEGNPANFLTVPVSTGTLVTGTTPVDSIATSGAIREVDAGGIDRYLFGTSSTFNDTTDVVKGKLKWDIDEDTRLFATLAYQEASSELLNHESYLPRCDRQPHHPRPRADRRSRVQLEHICPSCNSTSPRAATCSPARRCRNVSVVAGWSKPRPPASTCSMATFAPPRWPTLPTAR